MYKPCSSFNNATLDAYVMFDCNNDTGLLGEFIYIRDERPEQNLDFKLCEVQIFSLQGNNEIEKDDFNFILIRN